ncbi:hypothetical protein [Streptomyces platensis]|uniref:hypothetical protein n=1 Tax=Streptomyces platensis TaxID=58346 RepID=UPI0039B729DC
MTRVAGRLAVLLADRFAGSLPVRRLYPAGSGLAFTERRMGVDQILAVRPTPAGEAAMPPTPEGGSAGGVRR